MSHLFATEKLSLVLGAVAIAFGTSEADRKKSGKDRTMAIAFGSAGDRIAVLPQQSSVP